MRGGGRREIGRAPCEAHACADDDGVRRRDDTVGFRRREQVAWAEQSTVRA